MMSGCWSRYCLMVDLRSAKYVASRKLSAASWQNVRDASTQCRRYTLANRQQQQQQHHPLMLAYS
jgi:hypothetical protein